MDGEGEESMNESVPWARSPTIIPSDQFASAGDRAFPEWAVADIHGSESGFYQYL
jgi:hypothetical protein